MGLCLPMTEWFWNFKQAALTPRFVIPEGEARAGIVKKDRRSNVLRSRIRLRVSGMTTAAIRCRASTVAGRATQIVTPEGA